jgi:hypothetical protein
MSIMLEQGKSLGLWSFALPKGWKYDETHIGGDYLSHLGYDEFNGEKVIKLTYRFRYYNVVDTNDPYKDDDIKNWFSVILDLEKVTEAYAIASTREMMQEMATAAGTKLHEFLVGNDFKAFSERVQDAPFAYSRMATKEEMEDLRREHIAEQVKKAG